MYEAKYARYLHRTTARFAEEDEIMAGAAQTGGSSYLASGTPLYYSSGRYYLDDSDTHSLIIGPTGCKKTRLTVVPTVRSIIANRESAVINDPKLEIYRKTAEAARKAGARIHIVNMRDAKHSDGWNPLRMAYRLYDRGKMDEAQQAIADFAECVIAPELEKTGERYWGDLSGSVIKGVLMMYMQTVAEEHFHLKNIIPLFYADQFELLKKISEAMDPISPATYHLKCLTSLEAEKTKSCIYSTLLSMLAPFVQNQAVLQMLCTNSFELEELARRPTLIYLAYPDERISLNFLCACFITQCYETLVSYAAARPDDRLPIRVNFILDEVSNMTPIPLFDNRISEARSKNIRYFLYAQSYGQLRDKYGDAAECLVTNCGNWIVFSSKETEFLQRISDLCGKEIDDRGNLQPLISAYELQHLRKKTESAEVLILRQGKYPYITALPDYEYQTVYAPCPPASLPDITTSSKCSMLPLKRWISRLNGEMRLFAG